MEDGIYTEDHHIIPKSIAPELEKEPSNIVSLTAQEHFRAHYFLWQMYKEEGDKTNARKMCFAFNMMRRVIVKCQDVEAMSELYAQVREYLSKAMSEMMKGKASWNKGKKLSPLSEEHKRKISEANMGNQNMKGKHHSEEAKKKMSEAKKKNISEETRRKMALAMKGNQYMKGKHHSEETKHKMALVRKGKKLSEETKHKLSWMKKGKHWHIGEDGKRHYS